VDVLFLHSFVLPLHEGGGSKAKHVAEFMMYGWFMILHESCATVGVYETQIATASLLAELC
jgi:hypothetical protein